MLAAFGGPDAFSCGADPDEALRAVETLDGRIDDFTRRAVAVRDAALSVAQYVSGREMAGYDEAMRQMETKVREIARESNVRSASLEKLARRIRETRSSLLSYAAYLRSIIEVCRGLSLGHGTRTAGQGGTEAFLDHAAHDIFGIDESVARLVQMLDKLLAALEMQTFTAFARVQELDAALDLAVTETMITREELSARLEGTLVSIREFYAGWNELTAWAATLRGALRFSLSDDNGDPVPLAPEPIARPVAGGDVFRLARLAGFMGELCSSLKKRAGGRYSKVRSSSQGMKKALKDLTLSVEACLNVDLDMVKMMKAASEVSAAVFKGLVEIENTALKAELMVLNACMQAGIPREFSALAASMRRLSSITTSHIRYVGDQLAGAAMDMDPDPAVRMRMWKKINFTPAFAGVLEMDRDAWCLMESVLNEAGSLCAEMSTCIQGKTPFRGAVAERLKGNKKVKGSSL
jgi:hypothetical protein